MGIRNKLFAKKPNKGKKPNEGKEKKVKIKINCPGCGGRLTFSRDMTEELWNKTDRSRKYIMAICKRENAAVVLDRSQGHWDW